MTVPEYGGGAIPQPASQEEITATPLWHLYDYDLSHQTFTLMRIEEELYRETSFLDARVLEYARPTLRYELRHLAQMFPRLGDKRGPMGFIFHVGHCGSTLLSRALAVSPRVLPFREPMTLRTLSADHRELDTPMSFMARPDWEWLLTTVLDSLARRFRPDQVNIVKATSTGNNLIAPVLEESPNHRALLLHVPLEVYLATMLGKRKEGGDLWIQARTRMRDWMGIEAEPSFSLHELQAPHFAVLSWMTSMNYMIAARDRYGERARMLGFEPLIAEPDRHLPEAASFYGLAEEAESMKERFSEVSSGYSKRPDKQYTPAVRAQLLERARAKHAEDIRTGLEWARSLIGKKRSLEPLAEFID